MAPGLAHIGVLKVFEREKIPVDVVAGTSGGALFGAALACGISAGKLEKISRDVARKFLWFYSDFVAFPYSGFLRGKTLAALINKIIKDADFDDLVIPLEILASDLVTGEPVILNEGKVSEAIRASISVPGIFTPVEVKGRYLVDGAAISPVPVSILQQAGADIVIAVNVNSAPVDTNKVVGDSSNLFARIKRAITTPNIFDIIMQSRAISSHRMAELDSSRADVVVKPDTSTIRWRDYGKARQIIEQGEKAAEQMIPRIKDLLSLAN
jgi:NTE family protein